MKKEPCTKIPYTSQQEAEAHLRQIVEGNDYRDWKQKSPVRVYACPLHSKEEGEIWHLTSKPTVTKYR